MSLTITAGGSSIEFGVTAGYALMGEVTRTFTNARRIVRDVAYGSLNPYVDTLVTGEIEWTLSNVRVAGADAAALASLLSGLNDILTAAGTVTDSLGGATVTWERNPSLPILPNRTQHVEARSAWEGTITFYTTVTGAGAAAAALLTDEAMTSPSVVDLGTVTGDAPAPLAIDVNAGWDTGANGMRDCVLALVETTTLANYLYQAEDAGGWTVVTDADAQPDAADNAARTNSATWDDLAFGPVTAGTWRVFARAHREAGKSGYIALSEDGATSYQRTRITSSNYRLYDLGEFISDGVIDLHLLGMGTDYVTLDYVLLVPSAACVHYSYDGADHVDSWQATDAPTLTLASSASLPGARYMTGAQLYCPAAPRGLLVACADYSGGEPEAAVVVDASYVPQFYSWA